MLLNLFKKELNKRDDSYKIVHLAYRLRDLEVVENDNVVKQLQFSAVDPSVDNLKYKSSDFSLSNLAAVGAANMMRVVSITPTSDFAYVDSFATKTISDYVQVSEK